MMALTIINPVPVLSVNFLGIGIDVTWGITGEPGIEKPTVTLAINFILGQYLKSWTF